MNKNPVREMTPDEYIQEQEKGLVDFTENGECSHCGGCCSDRIPITRAEIVRIKKFVATNQVKIFNRAIFPLVKPTIDMTCPFRSPHDGCLIYPVRPWACKEFICSGSEDQIYIKLIKRCEEEKGDIHTWSIISMRNTIIKKK